MNIPDMAPNFFPTLFEDFSNASGFSSYILCIPNKKVPQVTEDDVVFFLPDELSIILHLPNKETSTGRRDLTILSFLYGSGARAQECCDLTVNDVIFSDKVHIRLKGKGGKTRRITLIKESASILKAYMKSRGFLSLSGDDKKRYVFSSQRNDHMSISCIEEIVAKYVRIAKKEYPDKFQHKSYTPHCFRHTIAVDMLQSGCSLPAIKSFLGHASIQSTQVYATVTADNANKVLRERTLSVTMPEVSFSDESAEDILDFLK